MKGFNRYRAIKILISSIIDFYLKRAVSNGLTRAAHEIKLPHAL